MTPEELGDTLARLVWESFSDLFSPEHDAETPLAELGVPHEEGVPDSHATEEALIFLMWAHTRSAELAFSSRASADLLHRGLDALHRAVFLDLVEHGTPRSHLPVFEQRASARYAAYNQAAARSDQALGRAVVLNLTRRDRHDDRLAGVVVERVKTVAAPLRDFLEEVQLRASG